MKDLNHVILIGRLTRDAELKYTGSGQGVCKFSIAVNRSVKRGDTWEDEANYFDITLWGRQGEVLSQFLIKGKQVAVAGELRQDRWEQDGQKRSKIEVIADSVQLLRDGKDGSDSQRGSAGSYGSQGGNSRSGTGQRSTGGGYTQRDSDDGFKDDIPF